MENPADQQHDDGDNGGGSSGFKLEHLRSYLNFAKFALRKRWLMLVAVLLTCVGLSVLASIYWPRTYGCTTVLMPVSSGVLEGKDTPNALIGAPDLILSHENLEAMIRDVSLVEKFSSRRPPLLHLKDRLMLALVGPVPRALQIKSLVGMLETKIEITTERGDLSIRVIWSDAQTAAELAAAARDSFIKARHTAEFSAFEEKMAILDGHGVKLRDEIGVLADQLKGIRDKKREEERAIRSDAASKAAEKSAVVYVAPRPSAPTAPIAPDTQTPELKEQLTALNAKLASTEADRDQRLRAAQSKLDDLKLKLTPSHPEVIAQQREVAMLSQPPSDLAVMRAEAKDLEAELKQRQGLSAIGSNLGGGGTSRGRARSVAEELLPTDVTDLLDKENLDPALTAQLSSTVIKYAQMRDELLSTRIDLDTAQAAFNHRYQIIVPAEVPTKPDKPKPGVVIGAGLLLSLLLALALPVVSELRKGVIVESWQVEDLQLPVLAELHLPPYSPD